MNKISHIKEKNVTKIIFIGIVNIGEAIYIIISPSWILNTSEKCKKISEISKDIEKITTTIWDVGTPYDVVVKKEHYSLVADIENLIQKKEDYIKSCNKLEIQTYLSNPEEAMENGRFFLQGKDVVALNMDDKVTALILTRLAYEILIKRKLQNYLQNEIEEFTDVEFFKNLLNKQDTIKI